MELDSIVPFLENKSILVIGAAGFLAKIFVEKVMRVQPNMKKLYLLLRAIDNKVASYRLHSEVFGKDLFRILKEQWGGSLNTCIAEKVSAVPGDISLEGMGLKDTNLRDEMLREIDVIINFAASTNFDERYDVALSLNTFGANNVLTFAKKCDKLKVYVHVSTAYVAGEREGLILEEPYKMGDSLNGVSGLNIDSEKKQMEHRLSELKEEGASEKEITIAMKVFGIERAKMYGWPNTYVFTKAMGEMLLGQYRENVPLVILRPTIITSTYKEPFPGWVEGIRTIDSLAVGYGKGKLSCFLGDINTILDVIPADMVVNSIIVAMVAHANQHLESVIYHVGSSVGNPFLIGNFKDYCFSYFTKNPWINKDGKPVHVGQLTMLTSMTSFHHYMAIRYKLPLKGLQLVNTASCQYFKHIYTDLDRKIKFVMKLVDLYKPYSFFKGVFDDMNTEKLRMTLQGSENDGDIFYFDPKSIDWEDYLMNTHIPGVVKYIFK